VLAAAALVGCVLPSPTSAPPTPGPRAVLRADAPIWVAWVGDPRTVAGDAGASSVDTGSARGWAGPALLALPWTVASGMGLARDCAGRRDGLDGTADALRAALPAASPAVARAFGDEVGRDWHPVRADPSVSTAPDVQAALAAAERAGHPVLLEVGPVELVPTLEPLADGAGCRAVLNARVTLRAVRVDGGSVRFETRRLHRVAAAADGEALRAWAGEPERVGAGLPEDVEPPGVHQHAWLVGGAVGGRQGNLPPLVAAVVGSQGAQVGAFPVEFLPGHGHPHPAHGKVCVFRGVAADPPLPVDGAVHQASVVHTGLAGCLGEPDGVQPSRAVGSERRAVVGTGVESPPVEGGTLRGLHPTVCPDPGPGVVTDVGIEHVAPEGDDTAVGFGKKGDAAALAAVVGHLEVGAEGLPAIARLIAVDRGATVAHRRAAVARLACHTCRR
jgi:hypothetical protein